MKLSDVEYQGDGTKATFYYTADERVDFRQLIRDLAGTFSIRVEMRQVGMRQEAARLGGVGSCGRELCCSTWLTDFRKVNTAAARYQQLSLNPLKLAGQCGKLKCCLNFELDTYLDALQHFPKQDKILKTEKGDAVFVKMDIFKKLVWYTYKNESFKWFRLSLDQVKEIIELNKNNELALPLDEYELEAIVEPIVDFENVVGQDSLTRFDAPKKSRNNRRKTRKPTNKPANKKEVNQSSEAKSNRKPQRKPLNKREDNKPSEAKPRRKPQRRPVNKEGNKPTDKKDVDNRKPKPRPKPRKNTNTNKPKVAKESNENKVQSQDKKPNNQKRRNNNQRRKKSDGNKNNETKNEK